MEIHQSDMNQVEKPSVEDIPAFASSGFATFSQLQRAIDEPSDKTLTSNVVRQLQQTHGNHFVLRLMDKANSNRHSEPNLTDTQRSSKIRESTQPNNPNPIQRIIHYEAGQTSTTHPQTGKFEINQPPHTMLVIGNAGAALSSDSFASCVGVTFVDKTNKWGAIAHFWAGKGTAKEVRDELAAVVEKIKSVKGIVDWDTKTVEVALHVGSVSDHLFSTRRSAELRKILSNYGTVGTETSGESVSLQVPT